MTAIIQRLPRRQLGIKDRDFIIGQQEAICLFPRPAEVLARFKVVDDELHMRTECQAIPPSGWYLVPPAGLSVLGLNLQVWVIDTERKTAKITFSANQEAQLWQIDSMSKV